MIFEPKITIISLSSFFIIEKTIIIIGILT